MSRNELVSLIEDAGFEAVERDTVYNPIDAAMSASSNSVNQSTLQLHSYVNAN